MKKYKIGEVSKMLNIPVETIRFLEQKGLISPQKNAENNYRFFDLQDIDQILDYKKYRQIGFSSKEAVEIIRRGDLSALLSSLRQKEQEAEKLAFYYQAKAKKMHNFQRIMKNAAALTGKFLLQDRPASYMLLTRSFAPSHVEFTVAQQVERSLENLTQKYSFVEHVYCIRQSQLENGQKGFCYQWGFTMKKHWLDTFQLEQLTELEYVRPTQAVFTILRLPAQQEISRELLSPALAAFGAVPRRRRGAHRAHDAGRAPQQSRAGAALFVRERSAH